MDGRYAVSDASRPREPDDDSTGMPDATSPALGIVKGPEFVLPPPHRLFAVFDEPAQAMEAIRLLAAEGIVNNDVWVYAGEQGAQAIEPAISKRGPGIALVRLAQRLLTNDCEYCELLSKSLLTHAMVVAVEVERPAVDAAQSVLSQQGGHSIAYGEHWDFVSVDQATLDARDPDESSTS